MLAIAGGKGGSGKTTTAIGLGSVLASRRRDPILVDADVDMPNLHIRAVTDDRGLGAVVDGTPVDEAATESTRYPGVDILGAKPGDPLDEGLRRLVTDRAVILDSPAGASERAVTPLRHADGVVVVTRDTPASVTDSVKTIRMANAVGTPVLAVVVSRAADVSDDVSGTLPSEPILAIPAVNDPVSHASARDVYSKILDNWVNA